MGEEVKKKPNHQMLFTCKKCPKSRMGEEVKKKTQPSDAVHTPDGWTYSL